MSSRHEVATLHVRAEKLKTAMASRANRKLSIEDPTASNEQQVRILEKTGLGWVGVVRPLLRGPIPLTNMRELIIRWCRLKVEPSQFVFFQLININKLVFLT